MKLAYPPASWLPPPSSSSVLQRLLSLREQFSFWPTSELHRSWSRWSFWQSWLWQLLSLRAFLWRNSCVRSWPQLRAPPGPNALSGPLLAGRWSSFWPLPCFSVRWACSSAQWPELLLRSSTSLTRNCFSRRSSWQSRAFWLSYLKPSCLLWPWPCFWLRWRSSPPSF